MQKVALVNTTTDTLKKI